MYVEASGQFVNVDKSVLCFNRNVDDKVKNSIRGLQDSNFGQISDRPAPGNDVGLGSVSALTNRTGEGYERCTFDFSLGALKSHPKRPNIRSRLGFV